MKQFTTILGSSQDRAQLQSQGLYAASNAVYLLAVSALLGRETAGLVALLRALSAVYTAAITNGHFFAVRSSLRPIARSTKIAFTLAVLTSTWAVLLLDHRTSPSWLIYGVVFVADPIYDARRTGALLWSRGRQALLADALWVAVLILGLVAALCFGHGLVLLAGPIASAISMWRLDGPLSTSPIPSAGGSSTPLVIDGVVAATTGQGSVIVAGSAGDLSASFLIRLGLIFQGPISQMAIVLSYRSFRPESDASAIASGAKASAKLIAAMQSACAGALLVASWVLVRHQRHDATIALLAIVAQGIRSSMWPIMQALRALHSFRGLTWVRLIDVVVLLVSVGAAVAAPRLLVELVAVTVVVRLVQLPVLWRALDSASRTRTAS